MLFAVVFVDDASLPAPRASWYSLSTSDDDASSLCPALATVPSLLTPVRSALHWRNAHAGAGAPSEGTNVYDALQTSSRAGIEPSHGTGIHTPTKLITRLRNSFRSLSEHLGLGAPSVTRSEEGLGHSYLGTTNTNFSAPGAGTQHLASVQGAGFIAARQGLVAFLINRAGIKMRLALHPREAEPAG
eukprot:scaffold101796_cov28-Tisochrysis_lutea.AAC.4